MFIGNFVSDMFGGIFVGLVSDKSSQVFVFYLIWLVITIIYLFIFQRNEFGRFTDLVKSQEVKFGYKTSWSPKVVWLILRISSALILSITIGLLIVFVKSLFT